MDLSIPELEALRGGLEDRLAMIKLIEDRVPPEVRLAGSRMRAGLYSISAKLEAEIDRLAREQQAEQERFKAEHQKQEETKQSDEKRKSEEARKLAEQGAHIQEVK